MDRVWIDSFVSTGRIVYDPPRGQMKRRTQWWCVIDVDREITRYFRWWVERRYGTILYKPSWDAHISVVRGEKPAQALLPLWKKYHKQNADFECSLHVKQSSLPDKHYYWYVSIHCPIADQIRSELQLKTGWTHHLTIGRIYEHGD